MARAGYFSVDSLKGVHVLVADDEALARDVVKGILEYSGALVLTAPTGRDALATMRVVKPDVLVTKLALPDGDAVWLLRQVRALKPEDGGKIPVVAVGGGPDDAERYRAEGFQAHFTWPLNPWEFCRTIAALTMVG
jgi:CheY-like chemotaxis protein